MAAFTFNGVDLATYGLDVVQGFRFPVIGAAALQTDGLPAAAKVISYRGESRPVEVAFPCRIKGTSAADLQAKIDSISAALSTPTADAALVFASVSAKAWMGQWDGSMDCEYIGDRAAKVSLAFTCQPYMVDAAASTASASGSGAVSLPAEGAIPGAREVPTTYTVQNTGTDVAAGAFVLSSANGLIAYSDAVPAGTYVRFRTDTRQAWVSADGLAWTEVFGKLTGSPNWAPLTGGVQNTVTVTGPATYTISIDYTGRYS
jgi:hypothetical protein